MFNKINDTLMTLSEKLKCDETKTIIIDECLKEINEILENEVACREFSVTIYSDILRFNEHRTEFLRKKNLFETLKLDKKQKKLKIGNDELCSYKYKKSGKNNKNIRLIYITDKEKDFNIFLVCFVEKNNNGKNGDYKIAIEKAIKRYNQIYVKE